MKKRLYFQAKISITCLVIAALMLRASYWQYERHIAKKAYIQSMQERLAKAPTPLEELLSDTEKPEGQLHKLPYRRSLVSGEFDFSQEFMLRNRRLENDPGVYVITPLKVSFSKKRLLLVRGFLPLSVASEEKRKPFQKQADEILKVLLKHSSPRRFMAPADPPTGQDQKRVDAFLRVDIDHISKQLPYEVFPFYAELMGDENALELEEKIVRTVAGREELFLPDEKGQIISTGALDPDKEYPIPVFDAVIPAGRHFGYIFEWIFLAFLTLSIGLLLQLKPPRRT